MTITGRQTTPLAVLEPMVAKEGMRTRRHPGGDALTLIPYLVPPAAVSDMRASVRALAAQYGIVAAYVAGAAR